MAVSKGKPHLYRPDPTSNRRAASVLEQREGEGKKTQTWEGDLLAQGRGEPGRMRGNSVFAGSEGEGMDRVLVLKS